MSIEKRKENVHDQSEVSTSLESCSRVAESVSLSAVMPSISCFAAKSGTDLTEFGLLYHTLVADGAIPMGFVREFMKLETPARRAAKKQQLFAASISDSAAETRLRNLQQGIAQRGFGSCYDHGSTRDCRRF